MTLLFGLLLTIVLILSWRKRNLRFQLYKGIGLTLWLTYITIMGQMMGYLLLRGGRWWYVFSVYTVAANDSSAYFAGVLFGKHHLIGLSPNKTIEGFVGGFLINAAVTYYVASRLLKDNFW